MRSLSRRQFTGGLALSALLASSHHGAVLAAQGSGEARTITHAMGETKVPANPQRVVVLDTGELDAAMTLGITPSEPWRRFRARASPLT